MYIYALTQVSGLINCANRMETSSPAFSLIIAILIGVLGLTSIGIYFSFGPASKKLVDPWEADDD